MTTAIETTVETTIETIVETTLNMVDSSVMIGQLTDMFWVALIGIGLIFGGIIVLYMKWR